MTAITLPPDLEAWARAEVAAGRAAGLDDLVASIVRTHRDLIDDHRELVAEAYRSMARGEVIEEAEADEIMDRWIAEDLAERR